ncbi:protein of unknown function [Legionella longbeachae NSW150]|uniref:Uncharacterized protein n=1 Tax=Legionella longbeachae serogroup 1 (strain NSW150) TaxID=661367 RepID=D3HJJ0_LEGLN|nr:protein of unknown function [Legionella longbeachae NSW150]
MQARSFSIWSRLVNRLSDEIITLCQTKHQLEHCKTRLLQQITFADNHCLTDY